MSSKLLEKEYSWAKNEASHINEHLPTFRELAKECNHITEMGVHEGRSTRGFLVEDVILRCYDVIMYDAFKKVYDIAKNEGKDIIFYNKSVLDVEIEETDLLFIDTHHNYEHLIRELKLHSPKVKKYILMHDTQTFGTKPENNPLCIQHGGYKSDKGLLPALIEFMIENPNWKFKMHKTNNNGLTLIEKT